MCGGSFFCQQCLGGTVTVMSVWEGGGLLLIFSTKYFRTLLPISVICLQAVTAKNHFIFILESRNMDTIIFSLPSSEKFSNALFVHSIKNGALGLEEGRVVGSPWVAESTGRQIERQDEY